MLKEFRDFILRGNVVELAVAVIIGAAFGAVVTAFTTAFVTPLIALIGGKPDFGGLAFTINGTRFPYGLFLNALISFLIIAAVDLLLRRRADERDHGAAQAQRRGARRPDRRGRRAQRDPRPAGDAARTGRIGPSGRRHTRRVPEPTATLEELLKPLRDDP